MCEMRSSYALTRPHRQSLYLCAPPPFPLQVTLDQAAHLMDAVALGTLLLAHYVSCFLVLNMTYLNSIPDYMLFQKEKWLYIFSCILHTFGIMIRPHFGKSLAVLLYSSQTI
jgi:hypothetical protein